MFSFFGVIFYTTDELVIQHYFLYMAGLTLKRYRVNVEVARAPQLTLAATNRHEPTLADFG